MKLFGAAPRNSRRRTASGERHVERSKMEGRADNIVIIDVESDSVPNVIIIDVPDSLEPKLRGSGVRKGSTQFPLKGVISIEDDGSSDDESHGISGNSGKNSDADACSSRKSLPSKIFRNIMDSVGDERQFVHESPFNLHKCKRTYSTKSPFKNRYGFYPDSEGDSSDSECSDCEITLREQWENASLKRKSGAQSGLEDQADVSGSQDATFKQHAEVPVCSSCNNTNSEEEDPCSFMETGYWNSDSASLNPNMEEAQFSYREPAGLDREETCAEAPFVDSSKGQTFEPVYDGCTGFCDVEEQKSQQPSSPSQEHDRWTTFSPGKRWKFSGPCLFNSSPDPSFHVDLSKDDVQAEEASSSEREHSVETEVDSDFFSEDKDEECDQTHLGSNVSSSDQSKHEESIFREKVSLPNQPSDETRVHHDIPGSDKNIETMLQKKACCQNSSPLNSDVKNYIPEFQEKVKLVFEEPSSDNSEGDEMQVKQGISTTMKEVEKPVTVLCNNRAQDTLRYEDGDGTSAVQSCIINGRERLKETKEYKKAAEEEWASRQRQLQIQAEEARRLRKKRRAESMRLLDMERRQKLRIQEMRETQKKDEEHMNLKEQLRAEARSKLNTLEMTCKDMASLLRCLGIHVSGGLYPSSNEVHTAYKRALLSFHPDRSSRSGIQQQVEAEEKFKLISRMKDKLIRPVG